MKKRTRVGLAMVAALAMGLTACGGGGGDPADPEGEGQTRSKMQAEYNVQPYENIKQGGTLTTAITEINAQMNVWHADMTAYTRDLWEWYNPVALNWDAEGNVTQDPDYYTDVTDEVVDGKTQVTYTINEQAVFNDGTPIDFRAMQSAFEACSGADEAYTCNSTDGYNQIESVEAGENDKQAVVTFKNEFPWWQGLFDTFLHPDAAAADVFQEGYVNEPHPEWGAGPYKVENIDPVAGTASFVPNEKWWGEDKAKLDQRVFQQMESQASLNAFRNGQLDATEVASEERLTQVQDMDGIEIRRGNDVANRLMMLNGESPMLGDQAVRQAVLTGIDRQVISDIAFQGLDYTEELPGSFLLFPWQDGYQDNFGDTIAFDPEQAKTLLDEAGWAAGEDGIRTKDGQRLTLNYPTFSDSATVQAQARAVQSMMTDIGVELNVQEKASADFATTLNAREFDMVSMGFLSSDPYGVAYACQVWCSDSQLNRSAVGTDEIDKLLNEDMIAEGTEEGQTQVANEAEKLGFEQYGIMPTYGGPEIWAVKQGLANHGADVFAQVRIQDIGWVQE